MSIVSSRLDQRIAATVRSDIHAAAGYAIQPSAGMVKLDAMENPFSLPEPLQRELGERLGRVAINRYPVNKADVAARLASHFDVPPGMRVMLGNGSDELIDILSTACARPGARVLAPVPGFVMYEMSARLRGLDFVGVPLTESFELDLPAMLDAVEQHRPALTYLAYPNNPTANLFNDDAVDQVVGAISRQDGFVVVDEAYQPFSSRTWMGRLAEHEHVLVLRTLSKFGLAGARIGYLAGPAALVEQVEKCAPPYNISALDAEAALFALDHADEYARQAGQIRSQRARLAGDLAEIPGVTVYPSEANMILIRVRSAAAVFDDLVRHGILVKNVAGLHPSLADCLRLTVGTPKENTAMLAALRASVGALSQG